jgi:uncharacterized protein
MIYFIGTLIDVGVILIAGLAGIAMGNTLGVTMRKTLLTVLGLMALVTGIKMVVEGDQLTVVLISVSIGAIIGKSLKLDRLFIARSSTSTKQSVIHAAITASVLSLAGPMAILGPLKAGLGQGNELLFIKSGFDAISTLLLAASMGIGVLLSALPVLLIQAAITIFATMFGSAISRVMMNGLASVSGIMIIAVGLDLLAIKKINIAIMLPSLCIVPMIVTIGRLLGGI